MDDFIKIKTSFLKELQFASIGKKSSLSYIKNALPSNPLIKKGLAQAVVIGGSNFEFATIRISGDKTYEILERKTGMLPILNTTQNLIEVFESNYNPETEAVALNFAFPITPSIGSFGELDGIFLHGTKEHTMNDLKGQKVGEFLKKQIYKKDIPIYVANDTVCLNLSGNGGEQAAMVLGTGFNMSLNSLIDGKKIIINLEAGNFDKFEIDPVVSKINKESVDPGIHMIEKATSGKYLVEIFNIKSSELNLNTKPLQDTKNLSILAESDQSITGDLAREIIIQSAQKIAAIIAGLYEYLKKPNAIEIITEGSLFWMGYKYHETVNVQLTKLGIKDQSINFKKVESSSLRGAINLLIN